MHAYCGQVGHISVVGEGGSEMLFGNICSLLEKFHRPPLSNRDFLPWEGSWFHTKQSAVRHISVSSYVEFEALEAFLKTVTLFDSCQTEKKNCGQHCADLCLRTAVLVTS